MNTDQPSLPIPRQFGFSLLTQVTTYGPAAFILLGWMFGFAGGWALEPIPATVLLSLSGACALLIWTVAHWTLYLSPTAFIIAIGPYQRTIAWDTVTEAWQYGSLQLEIVPHTGRPVVLHLHLLDQPAALVGDVQHYVGPQRWYHTSTLIARPARMTWIAVFLGLAQLVTGQGISPGAMLLVLFLIAGFSLVAEVLPWIYIHAPHAERTLVWLERVCLLSGLGSWYVASTVLRIREHMSPEANATVMGLVLVLLSGPALLLRPLVNRSYHQQARQHRSAKR